MESTYKKLFENRKRLSEFYEQVFEHESQTITDIKDALYRNESRDEILEMIKNRDAICLNLMNRFLAEDEAARQ